MGYLVLFNFNFLFFYKKLKINYNKQYIKKIIIYKQYKQ